MNLNNIVSILNNVFVILLFSSLISFSLTNGIAYGCSCMQPLSPDEELPNYEAVFSGMVTQIQNLSESQERGPILFTFDVDNVWKGDKKETITIKTAQSSASCGFNFEENQKYIVYANQYEDDYLEVSLCSRTGLLSNAIEDIQELGDGFSITPEIDHMVPSPLKQFKSGVPIDEIQCRDSLVLLKKYDNSPACVKPESASYLENRGWTILEQNLLPISEIKPNLFSDGITEIINEEHAPLKYYNTNSIISETFLDKDVEQWQQVSFDYLMEQHEKYPDDEFFTDLGALLIKNEMTNQIKNFGIINVNDDFTVAGGYSLDSLPPHIGFSTVINATDGNSYLLEGGTHANQVNYYKTTQLTFYDTMKKLSLESLLTTQKTITILPEKGTNARADPSVMILYKNDTVEFFNDSNDTVRIQDSGTGKIGEEHLLDWIGPTIPSSQKDTMTFEQIGYYEWDGRKAPTTEYPDWWETHASGRIIVLDDDMNNLSQLEKALIARAIISDSEIPVRMSGIGTNDILYIGLDSSVTENIPDAEKYYESRILQLIPFEVEFKIDR